VHLQDRRAVGDKPAVDGARRRGPFFASEQERPAGFYADPAAHVDDCSRAVTRGSCGHDELLVAPGRERARACVRRCRRGRRRRSGQDGSRERSDKKQDLAHVSPLSSRKRQEVTALPNLSLPRRMRASTFCPLHERRTWGSGEISE
jgi:hypothetical protein